MIEKIFKRKNSLIFLLMVMVIVAIIFVTSKTRLERKFVSCSNDSFTDNQSLDYSSCLLIADRFSNNLWTRELWLMKTNNSDRGQLLFSMPRNFVWDKKQEMDLDVRWEDEGLRLFFNHAEIFVKKDVLLEIKNP